MQPVCVKKMMYFFRNYEWGFPGMGPGGPGGIVPGMAGAGAGGPPAIPSSVAPTTADVIAQQSQVIFFFYICVVVTTRFDISTFSIRYSMHFSLDAKILPQITLSNHRSV